MSRKRHNRNNNRDNTQETQVVDESPPIKNEEEELEDVSLDNSDESTGSDVSDTSDQRDDTLELQSVEETKDVDLDDDGNTNSGDVDSTKGNDTVTQADAPARETTVKKKHDIDSLMEELKDRLTDRELKEWTYSALLEFKENGTRVERSKRGNYKQSRIRPLSPSEWTVEELMDWLEGNVEGHRNTRKEAILDEIYLRWKIPPGFTEEDAKSHVLHGTNPEATDKGILVNDRRRDASRLNDLTHTELCSIYLDEVKSKFTKSEVKRRIMTINRILDEDQFDSVIEDFKGGKKNMTTLADQLMGTLEAREALYRKYDVRVTDQQLAKNTTAFYNNLRNVTKADYAEFAECWRVLLKYADDKYNTIFNPSQIRRGWAWLELSPGNVNVLDRLLVLIMGTRVAATRRSDVREFKLDYILEHVNNQKERDNIIMFYTED